MSAVPTRESVHRQQQRDRSAIPLRLVFFTFLLWTPPSPFDDVGDATARPPRDPRSSASTPRQRYPLRAERIIASVRRRSRGSNPPSCLQNGLWRSNKSHYAE